MTDHAPPAPPTPPRPVRRRRAPARRPGVRPAADAVEPRRRPAAGRRRGAPHASSRSSTRRARGRRGRPAGRAPEHRPRRRRPRRTRRWTTCVLLRLSELTGVTVDPGARTARVLGGTQWHEVVAAAAPHGLTALHGSAPDVAVAGYVLGGGLSFYARQHGLGSGTLRGRRGRHRRRLAGAGRRDRGRRPLLGASAAAAAASASSPRSRSTCSRSPTSSPACCCGTASAPPRWCRAWAAWTRDLPDSVTTSLRVMSFPPLPELPPFLSGRRPRGRRRRRARGRRAGRRAARPAARARPGDGHLRPDPRGRADSRCTWTRPPRCRPSASTRCSSALDDDAGRRLPRRRSAPARRTGLLVRRARASSAAPSPPRPRVAARSTTCPVPTPSSRSRSPPTPEAAAAGLAAGRAAGRRAGAVGDRPAVPQLRRPRRPGRVGLRRRRLGSGCAPCATPSTRAAPSSPTTRSPER